jgi:hypothetical protein
MANEVTDMVRAFRPCVQGSLISLFLVAVVIGAVTAPGACAEKVMPPSTIISSNPILDIFGWYNLELEHRVKPNSTVGLAGSYVDFDEEKDTYKTLTFFYRYYPQNEAPAGFFFGGRAGVFDVSAGSGDTDVTETYTLGGVGIDIGYTWMIGTTRNFAISLGIGAVRLFGDTGDSDVATALPTIRLVNIGFAF